MISLPAYDFFIRDREIIQVHFFVVATANFFKIAVDVSNRIVYNTYAGWVINHLLKIRMDQPMKTIVCKTLGATVVISLAASLAAKADTLVYDNSTSNTSQSLNLANGYTIGNEILLSGAATISSFEFELFNPTNLLTGTVTMSVNLYANTGSAVSGYPSPSTSLFSDSFTFAPPSGAYTPYYPGDGTGGYGLRVIESGLSVAVPNDFTLAITVSGLSGPDSLGLELYNSVTTGNAYNDYWYNTGTGWQLLRTGTPGNNNFGARFYVVPEPSVICLGLVGGALLIFGLRQRRCSQIERKSE